MKRLVAILALILLVTGCGSNNNNEENNNNETNTVVEDYTMEDFKRDLAKEDDLNTPEVYTDDTKIVFKKNDNVLFVYYHEGNTLTGLDVYQNYEDSITASVAVELINRDKAIKYPTVIKAVQKGRYAVISYNASEYEGYNLASIKVKYAALEIVTKK